VRQRWIAPCILTMIGLSSGAATAASPVTEPRTSLLELYTSEGCNSCPPADRWVSQLPRPALVPNQLVVLAFHVDYWNYLGWSDRFAQSAFSDRQRQLSRTRGWRTIYTPQLVLNGQDYRDDGSLARRVSQWRTQPAAVRIRLDSQWQSDTLRLTAVVDPLQPEPRHRVLYLAVYENNLESDVKAGENRGVWLHHDYVVRALLGPKTVARNETVQWQQQVDVPASWKRQDLGIAAFVQDPDSAEILQAVAKPLR